MNNCSQIGSQEECLTTHGGVMGCSRSKRGLLTLFRDCASGDAYKYIPVIASFREPRCISMNKLPNHTAADIHPGY